MHITTRTYAGPLLTLACCTVFHGVVRSQQLSADDVLVPIGSSYRLFTVEGPYPWNTLQGPGVTWEYDWVAVDEASDLTMTSIAVAQSPHAAAYPDADRAMRSISGPADDYIVDSFFDDQGDRLIELGSAGPVLSYLYDGPETNYVYPMALGDTVHGDYCFWSDGFGVQYHFCGANYVTFDATGTLILPYGTFTDVKHVTNWRSLLETTEPATDSTHSIQQQWFVPGIPYPVMELSLYIDADGTQWPNGRLMDAASLTAVRERAAPDWQLAPNPTIRAFTVQRTAGSAATVDVLTTDGRLVHSSRITNGSTQHRIDLDGLPEGIYLVRISDATGSTTKRVVKMTR